MFTGESYSAKGMGMRPIVVVWDLGDSILASDGEIYPKSILTSSGFKVHQFIVSTSVYGKLAKIIEGVRVSEFLNVGDEVLMFNDHYDYVVLHRIVKKDFENGVYLTDLGKMIPFGTLKGVYTRFTYSK